MSSPSSHIMSKYRNRQTVPRPRFCLVILDYLNKASQVTFGQLWRRMKSRMVEQPAGPWPHRWHQDSAQLHPKTYSTIECPHYET
jgi:hypothetical protein